MNDSYTITTEQVEAAALERVEIEPWGFRVYVRAFGKWELSHLLIPEADFRRTHKVYPDSRPSEIIAWAA